MLSLLMISAAYAQTPDGCGALCNFVEPVLYGVPFFAGILGAAAATLWHRALVSAASRAWRGGGVSGLSLWMLPLIGGYAIPMLGAVALLGLAIWKPDFLTLLLMDARELPAMLVWAGFALILPAAPLFVALARRN